MRSLFLKIFLWFWLAITLLIAALALVTWLYPHSAVPTGRLPDRLHELQVRGVFAVYELKGLDAYEHHRSELQRASRLKTYIIDDKGHELSDETVPDYLLEFAGEHAAELDRGERVMADSPSRLAIPLTGADGRKYRALVEPDRPLIGMGGEGSRERGPGRDGFRDGPREGGPPRDFDRMPPTTQSSGPTRAMPGVEVGGRGPGMGRGPGGPPPEPAARFELLVPTHVLLLRLLAVILAAGLGCYLLARYLTSPVRELQSAARQLASGDLTARVGRRLASRRDEIGELGRDFDRMANQVETLLTAHRRLLRDVSHELRSPLARLNVALELAARDGGAAVEPAVARVRREAERLNELIGQLLTLVRLEGGATQPRQDRIDLAALVNDVVADAEFEAAALERHVRITGSDACSVLGDQAMLRSAIENVVRNALHYTAELSEVEVSLRVAADDSGGTTAAALATLEIRDHGPGVPEESLRHIFEPFYRVSDARDRNSGGVGLGLAIVDRAIRLHGGTIAASNAQEGGGLIVQIQLPVANDAKVDVV